MGYYQILYKETVNKEIFSSWPEVSGLEVVW